MGVAGILKKRKKNVQNGLILQELKGNVFEICLVLVPQDQCLCGERKYLTVTPRLENIFAHHKGGGGGGWGLGSGYSDMGCEEILNVYSPINTLRMEK